jgi:hypothetical protein
MALDETTHVRLPAFNDLLLLARTDPHALERLRERLTDNVIGRAGSPARLRGLKFRIDMELRLARDPYDACLRLSAMMHRSFADLRAVLAAPDRYRRPRHRAATIIVFPTAPDERL